MKYNKDVVARIVQLVEEDTYTVSEICEMMNISRTAFYKWKNKNPNFVKALNDAANIRDQKLVVQARKSLRKKIEGFTATETKTTYVAAKDDDTEAGLKLKERVVTEKYHAPDTSALVFVLTNRDSLNWRSKHSTELSGADNQAITIVVANSQVKTELEKLQSSSQD